AMRTLGASRIEAALGPCIHPECYEFSPADLDHAAVRFGPTVRGATATGRPALDLPETVRVSLQGAEIELVADEDICTACSPRHFSYRARGERQRMALAVWRA
ncbi:MAG TPA: laccase domain-containing protein, partial [Isosphaeraceae bacterium]